VESRELFKNLLNKPFQWGGRGPDGYDCLGLCIEIYRRLGQYFPDIQSPGDDYGVIDGLVGEKKVFFERLAEPEAYCLATFAIQPPYVSHIAVMLENLQSFIHVRRNHNVVISKLDRYWQQRLAGFYKIAAA
jgi:cell wall-associated NlpC family hydrolase